MKNSSCLRIVPSISKLLVRKETLNFISSFFLAYDLEKFHRLFLIDNSDHVTNFWLSTEKGRTTLEELLLQNHEKLVKELEVCLHAHELRKKQRNAPNFAKRSAEINETGVAPSIDFVTFLDRIGIDTIEVSNITSSFNEHSSDEDESDASDADDEYYSNASSVSYEVFE